MSDFNLDDLTRSIRDPDQESDPMQEEPSADARSMARSFRDLYVSFINEGFSRKQSFILICEMVKGASTIPERDDP